MLINTKKKDVVWNYLGIITSLGVQILILPVLVKYLEVDMLGIWYIFVSIGSIVTLFDFGFNPTIARTIAYCWSGTKDLSKNDVNKIKKNLNVNYELLFFVIKTCKYIYLIISSLALIIMLTIGTIYISSVVNALLTTEIYIAWIIYALSIFLNLYIGYYSVALRGIGDIYNLNRANVISKVAFLIISIMGLITGAGILSLAFANLISGCLMRFISAYLFYNINDIKLKFNNISFTNTYSIKYVFNNMWYNAWREGFISITVYLTNQATTLLCASFLSLTETGIYSFCLQIVVAIMNISGGMYISCQPALQSAYINNNKELLKKLFSLSIFIYYLVFFIGCIIFISIGIPIIHFIKNDFYIDKLMFILLSLNIFIINRHRLSASFISNMNKLPYLKSFVSFGVLSLLISFIFMKYFNWGVYSLIIIPIVIQSIYNNWKWNKVVNKYLEINEFKLLLIGYQELRYKISFLFNI